MEKIKEGWVELFSDKKKQPIWWERKKELWKREKGSIVKVKGRGEPLRSQHYDRKQIQDYLLHLSFLIKQEEHYHIEEQVLPYRLELLNEEMMKHDEIVAPSSSGQERPVHLLEGDERTRQDFVYDRREAVRYAERWWNSYNPEYPVFEVDCTNYISQCLHAGGAPMRGAPDRSNGWWYQQDNWSYSWAVSHSMRWYLSGSTTGLQARELDNPENLIPGDVICYDFEGDGRFDHTTIVVNKDAYGMPLVNAHTDNSRNRYWSYEDSLAWTPDIQYKFFRIED